MDEDGKKIKRFVTDDSDSLVFPEYSKPLTKAERDYKKKLLRELEERGVKQ